MKIQQVARSAIVAVFLLTGCAVRNTTLTPVQQVSFTLNQSLSIVAEINKSLASDVISISNAGLISKPLTNSILTWQKAVAQQIIAAETIQRSSQTEAQKALAIKAAFSTLPLPADVQALLKAPQTNQAIVGLIATMQSIQSLIVALKGGA